MSLCKKILLGGAVLAVGMTVAAHPVDTAKAGPTKSQAQDLTLALIDANAQYTAAAPGDKGLHLGQLMQIARDRHDAMSAIIGADPAEVLKVALPASLRASFPGEAAPFLEQDAQEDGTLEVFHVDNVDPANNRYLYVLNTTKGKLSLNFAGHQPALLTGAKVRVNGVKVDNALALNSGTSNVTTLAAAALPNTLGAQKTLTMLVNFTDEQTQPYTVADAQAVMFTTTSNFDYEASYQQTWLTGDVAGWFTLPVSSTTCDYSAIGTYANQAASRAGFVLSNYTRYVYVFPANACTWWGLGTVGGNPSQAWIHSKWGFTLPVVGHEMGHNFGLYHSHSLDCGSVTVADSGCTTSEYGDIFDMMGSSNTTPHFNAFQKERLGWLNAGASPPLTTVSARTGTYTIKPMEAARDTSPRALKIPKTTSCTTPQQWYYVESRQAQGFDAFLAGNSNVLAGVLMHQVTDGDANSSYLLDMTAGTDSWSDAALDAGLSFTDPATGLTITPTSVGSSATTVSVTLPGASCTHVAPTIALTPTGTEYTSAGATATYTVTVTNNDGCGCTASTFDVNATVPVGWSANNPRTGGIAPGAMGSTSLSINTASSAAAAFYTIPSTAANTVAPAYAATANGTVAVITSLGVGVTTDKGTYVRPTKGNQTLNVAITTTATSSTGALSGAGVSVQVADPRGAVTTLVGTTGTNGTATVAYPIKSKSLAGTYAVTSKATMGATSSSATATFSVQ